MRRRIALAGRYLYKAGCLWILLLVGIFLGSSDRTMTPHDDALALQRQIAARAAFPESRGLVYADKVCSWLAEKPRRIEGVIGSAIGAAGLLVLFGWALRGRR